MQRTRLAIILNSIKNGSEAWLLLSSAERIVPSVEALAEE